MARRCGTRTSSWSAPATAAVAGWARWLSKKPATKFPQRGTAQRILFEGGGDYALTVKENQKELVQTLATLLTPGKFTPSGHDADPRADAGAQSEPAGNPGAGMPRGDARTSEFSWSATDCTVAAAGA